jgi:hypothetical protein
LNVRPSLHNAVTERLVVDQEIKKIVLDLRFKMLATDPWESVSIINTFILISAKMRAIVVTVVVLATPLR